MHVITVADSHNELIFLHPRKDPATAQYKKKTRLIVRDVHTRRIGAIADEGRGN